MLAREVMLWEAQRSIGLATVHQQPQNDISMPHADATAFVTAPLHIDVAVMSRSVVAICFSASSTSLRLLDFTSSLSNTINRQPTNTLHLMTV